MSHNTNEAERIIALLKPLPSKMLGAVSTAVYKEVLLNTLQDSGEAAFNWRAGVNGASELAYVPSRGRDPVGSTGDKRTLSGNTDQVVAFRLQQFLSEIASADLTSVHIYNPVPEANHAMNARLEIAKAASTGQDFIDQIAERALNANLPKR